MLVTEQPPSARAELENKRELRLSQYSPNLSHRILTRAGKEPLGLQIPDAMIVAFQKGSLADRNAYWEKVAPGTSFGQQMVAWLGDEESPGISQWVAQQSNPNAVLLLQEVGLKSQTPVDMQDQKMVSLLETINNDLQASGKDPLTNENLTEDEKRSLFFYANFLNPQDKKGKQVGGLINRLVSKASDLSNGNSAQMLEQLQAIAPLFRVAGEEGQHVLAALVVAKSHAQDSRDILQQASVTSPLNEEEKRVWKSLQENRDIEPPEPLNPREQRSVVEVFRQLEPEVESEGNPYFIEGDLPTDFVANLSPEQLGEWELRKSFFILQGKMMFPNREIFAPADTLKADPRFLNGERLTNNDSGLFALAAASAPTPEKQAALYRTLGEVITRVHHENPKLLEEFLQAQSEESLRQFLGFDYNIAESVVQHKLQAGEHERTQQVLDDLDTQFGSVDLNNLTREQGTFMREKFFALTLPIQQDVFKNFSQDASRLFAIGLATDELHPGENNLDSMLYPVLDMPTTLAAWPGRVTELQEALHHDPLTLTPEQIRQIEFLAHSVDVVQAIKLLQQKASGESVEANSTADSTIRRRVSEAPTAGELHSEISTTPVNEENRGMTRFFDSLTIPPKEGNNFYTNTPDMLRPIRRIVDDWKTFLLRIPIGNPIHPNLGTYVLQEDPQSEEVSVKGFDYSKQFLQHLFQPRTRANEAQDTMWDTNVAYYRNNYNGADYEMDSTIVAFAADAAATPQKQAQIFSTMAQQILLFYDANPELGEMAKAYFTHINRYSMKWPPKDIDSLLGTQTLLRSRTRTIREHLKNNQLTEQDFLDISLLSLPFDLRKLAIQMMQSVQPTQDFPDQ